LLEVACDRPDNAFQHLASIYDIQQVEAIKDFALDYGDNGDNDIEKHVNE
jgi:hypothetical protein